MFQAHPIQDDYLKALRSIWSDIDLEQYAAQVSKRYGVLDLSILASRERDDNIPILLKEVFVEPFVNQTKTEPVLKALSKKNRKRVMVLGNPGSGKSTLARYLLLSLLNPSHDATGQLPAWLGRFKGHLPLLIELRHYREYVGGNQSVGLLEYFHHLLFKAQGSHLNLLKFKEQLKVCPSLIIFDGLNEIAPCKREEVTQEIIRFAKKYSLARIVVTSRIVGYQGYAFQSANFQEYTLQDLQPEQIKTFAQGWFNLIFANQPDEVAFHYQRIAKALQHSPTVCQLAGNPLLLTMMVSIAKHQELPRERVKLYEHASKVLCHHWEIEHSQETLSDLMLEDDKLALLRHIAWRMQAIQQELKANTIKLDDLQGEIEDYLQTRCPDLPSVKVTNIAHGMIEQLSEHKLIFCQYDEQSYQFVHQILLEYFCATEIVDRLRPSAKEKLTFEKLKTEIFLTHYTDDTWHEVLRFLCGLVEPQLAGELINAIVPARKESMGSDSIDCG